MINFTHLDENGKVSMVDISDKKISLRNATARSIVHLPQEILNNLSNGDIITKKGSVLQTAVIAGIMAAKRTGELIPLCHPLGLDNCSINIQFNEKKEL